MHDRRRLVVEGIRVDTGVPLPRPYNALPRVVKGPHLPDALAGRSLRQRQARGAWDDRPAPVLQHAAAGP